MLSSSVVATVGRSLRALFACVVLLPLVAATGADPDDASDDPPLSAKARTGSGADRVWELTNYLKGTPKEIAEQLQKPVDEFSAKLADAKRRVEEREAAVAKARDAALARVQASEKYKALEAELRKAQQAWDDAKLADDIHGRMEASGRLNKTKRAMQEMDAEAIRVDSDIAYHLKHLSAERPLVSQYDASLQKSRKWRDEVIAATLVSCRIPGPLGIGSAGILGDLTVKTVLPKGAVLADGYAWEKDKVLREGEGIETSHFTGFPARYLIADFDKYNLKPGQKLTVNEVFAVTSVSLDADLQKVYVMRRHPGDIDALLKPLLAIRGK